MYVCIYCQTEKKKERKQWKILFFLKTKTDKAKIWC